MASCLYLASNFNRLQSASNVLLDVNVQEGLPAVQMSCYVRMTSRKWWAMVTVPWLPGFCGSMGANQWVYEKPSYAVYVHFGTLDLIRTAIEQVGICLPSGGSRISKRRVQLQFHAAMLNVAGTEVRSSNQKITFIIHFLSRHRSAET